MAISITSRIRNAMLGLTMVLCALFTGLIFLLVYIIEDQVFINQIKAEQVAFEQVIAKSDTHLIRNWRPTNANIERIDEGADLPHSLPDTVARSIVAKIGIHEYFDRDNAMFIASLRRPNDGLAYYLVYDVKHLLAVQKTKRILFAMIGGLTLLITIVAVLLARQLTKSTLAPVTQLSNALQTNDLDHVVIDLANQFSEDEIGILTHELAKALERVRASSEREYEFNRGVSHELRSPIQVAQSTTELLQLYTSDTDPRIIKSVSRLQRSVAEMSDVAEAFLWLASDRVVEQDEKCSAAELRNTVVGLQSSFPDHEIVFNIDPSGPFFYPLPSTVMSVVLRSLVRNAMIHGDSSPIVVDMCLGSISVRNSVGSSLQSSRGFGIGMNIVQRICDRFDCDLTTQVRDKQLYVCSIVFE